MAEGRRHSVDIPIVKTLVALRRVRSLRDPSTNSMSTFPASDDSVNWETNSSNGISLHFPGHFPKIYSDNRGILRAANLGCDSQKEGTNIDLRYYQKPRKALVESTFSDHIEVKQVEGSDYCRSNHGGVHVHKSLTEIDYRDYKENEFESTNCFDDIGLSNEQIIGLSPQRENLNHVVIKQKAHYKDRVESSCDRGDVVSLSGGSSYNTSFFANDNFEDVCRDQLGDGVSCCWLRTPRFSNSNFRSYEDGRPLLKNEIVPYIENPSSFIYKFKPQSFDDLLGHNVIVRSLLTAISKGRISSFYIFHGPRGTGKSSASRIFAAALNCLSLEERKPCGICRECHSFFHGKSKDVKEVDSVRINSKNRIRSFMRNAIIPPVTSRFKVFIVDECQFLGEETWATILNSIDEVSHNVVFIMATTDIDKVPRSAVSRSQNYYFSKIRDVDISNKLEKISIEEGLDSDSLALGLIAVKSNGSLRDAEMILDQLSLIGKKITTSLVYELIGVVPDDELLSLLDLALSGETSKTVVRAREMMRSRIDPLQLISQLANLIMDILVQDDTSRIKMNFFIRHTSEGDTQKLCHALRVLSEAEKQLRRSKNQMTWLIVALLRLSSADSTFFDPNDSTVGLTMPQQRDGGICCTPSAGEISKCLVTSSSDHNNSHQLGVRDCEGNLEVIWKKATDLCRSRSLRKFLWNKGKLSSIHDNQGVVAVGLDFHHHRHVVRAERSWKSIAGSLQSIMGCKVGIRINLVSPCISTGKKPHLKKSRLSLFCCSGNNKPKPMPPSTSELGLDRLDASD